MARKSSIRIKKSPIPTLIGAGITEQWYFKHLKTLKDYRVKIRPRFFGTETANGMAKRIEEVLQNDGFAICVFDADVSTWNELELKKWNVLRRKYKDNPSVMLCDSLPSIEYWFLLHYESTNRFFGTSRAVGEELKKFISQYDKTEQFLQNQKWVADMIGEGRQEEACNRAEMFGVEGESYTNVYKAVKLMGKTRHESN